MRNSAKEPVVRKSSHNVCLYICTAGNEAYCWLILCRIASYARYFCARKAPRITAGQLQCLEVHESRSVCFILVVATAIIIMKR